MARASLIAVAGAALLVGWQDGTIPRALDDVPTAACVEAIARTAEQRIDHLVTVVRLVEDGAAPRSLPHAPSDASLAVCPG